MVIVVSARAPEARMASCWFSSTVFRVFRLIGVVAITITGVVYHSVLAQLLDLESWALVADHALHTISPILAVVGWLMFGPRGLISPRIVWLSAIFPVCWCIFTLVRGEMVGFYPYPFVDVGALGYGRVFATACGSRSCTWAWPSWRSVSTGGSPAPPPEHPDDP